MYAIHDPILYGTTGVCRITDIREVALRGAGIQPCYVLSHVEHAGEILYVPLGGAGPASRMHAVPDREAALALIDGLPSLPELELGEDRERSRCFQERLESGRCDDLAVLVKTLYGQRLQRKARGKNLNQTEGRTLDLAARLLHEALGVALGLPAQDVPAFIRERLEAWPEAVETA